MASSPPDLSILGYDLRASGVVRNALRIAGAAHAGGLKTELWVARDSGPLRAEVPQGVTVVAAERQAATSGRSLDLARSIRPLAAYLRDRKPRIALSSGNHMHIAASLAHRVSGTGAEVSLWARASNATLKTPLSTYLGRPLPDAIADLVDYANGLQYRRFDRIIAVADELAAVLTNDLGIERRRITVISNGIDVDAIARQAAAPLDDPWFTQGSAPVIVSAGRLSRQKNFGDLIRAVAMVRDRLPVRLIILGEGPASARQGLEKTAANLGVGEHLRLPGFEANPYRFMARASVFALSSLWEGASNVVLEALASGSPVAAYRCPTGIGEVLDPLGNESLVNPHDVGGLAGAIMHRVAHPQEERQLRAYAGRFTLARTLDAYVDCFSAALQAQPSA